MLGSRHKRQNNKAQEEPRQQQEGDLRTKVALVEVGLIRTVTISIEITIATLRQTQEQEVSFRMGQLDDPLPPRLAPARIASSSEGLSPLRP